MQIEQRFELPRPPASAWPAFQDIALLVDCLPGAALTGPVQDGEVPLRFDVKLGPIAAGFVGSGKVSFEQARHAGRFEGAAADRKTSSRVKGAADFSLAAQGEGTVVTVRVDYTLSGALAQFGRAGIVRELATALTTQFAANLESRLGAVLPAAGAVAPAMTGAAEPLSPPAGQAGPRVSAARPAAVAPLAGGALLLQVLRARWARFTQRFTPGRTR